MNDQRDDSRRVRVIGVFHDQQQATRFVERLIDEDFPMDQLSLLHKGGGQGDDPLGVVYTGDRERIKVWGEQGLLWGALGGLLAGLSGLFVVPGVGALLAAGPIVEALVGAVTGGAAMAGAAAVTSVTTAFRRLGIPTERLQMLEEAIQSGHYVVLLHADGKDTGRLSQRLALAGADPVLEV